MRVLILSCNTGEGHNAAGKAVLECVRARGHEAVMTDVMLLAGKRASRAVGGAYVEMVKHVPGLFHALYRAGDLISSAKRKSPVYYANTLLGKPLQRYLEQHAFDVIVTPHLFAAEALTCLRRRNLLRQPVVAVTTDYTCIPFWEETDCDFYILPHNDLTEEYVRKGLPREKLLPLGIPVRTAFLRKKEKSQVKRSLGLPLDRPSVLVMNGSMGCGKMPAFAEALARASHGAEDIVMICGSNDRLRAALREQFHENPRVHILGYTEQVSDYMDACDVVFTKPGGLSSTEAAVKQIPIVHTAPIPGCETRNLAFFTSRGMSVTAEHFQEQIALGRKLAWQADRREKMLAAQREYCSPEAPEKLFRLLLRLSGEDIE